MKGKRLLLWLVVLMMILSSLLSPVAGEEIEGEMPYLDLSVAYGDANSEGDISATVILSLYPGTGSASVSSANNVEVKMTGENGLAVASASSYHFDSTDGTVWGVQLHYQDPSAGLDPENPPIFRINISSDDCGGLEYTCVFDVQPETRAFILFRSDVNYGDTIRNAAVATGNALLNGTYYGLAIQGDSSGILYENTDIWSDEGGLGQLAGLGIDDNDLTYFYIVIHGSSNGYLEWMKDDGTYTSMEEVLKTIVNTVSGRAVIMLDSCYSGQIVKQAPQIALDSDRFFVASSTSANYLSSNENLTTEFASLLSKLYQGRKESVLCSDLEAEMRSLDIYLNLITGSLPAEAVTRSTAFASLYKSAVFAHMTNGGSLFFENAMREQLNEQMIHLKDNPQDSLLKRGLIHAEKALMESSAHPFNTLKKTMRIFWPQSYGNSELPLFANGTNFDDGFRLLVTEKETLEKFGNAGLSCAVQNADGDPLSGVAVTCVRQEDGQTLHTTANGGFTFEHLLAGTYDITCEKDGFEVKKLSCRVEANSITVLMSPIKMIPLVLTLGGRITDIQTGNSITDAIVIITHENGTQESTVSDENGRWKCNVQNGETVNCVFMADGYEDGCAVYDSYYTKDRTYLGADIELNLEKKLDIITFGLYEQDNNLSNGPEPIEWIVVGISEKKALLLSRYILDFVPFYDGESHYCYYYSWDSFREYYYNSRDWAGCNLRYWLNHDFYENSFSYMEKNRILKTEVTDGPIIDDTVWTTVEDSVFVMSASFGELNETLPGGPSFNPNWDFAAATATPYALTRTSRASDGVWYLRDNNGQDVVGSDGQIMKYTYHDGPAIPEGLSGGVRPAICVSLSVLQGNK